jgi:serine/threonine protein kinase
MSAALLQAVTTYRLGRRLGHGGFAEVFAGEALGAEGFVRPVAIKRLLTEDPSARAALVQEAQLLAQLRHPNIVAVLDLVEATAPDRALHLVLEYMDGGTLGELALHGPAPLAGGGIYRGRGTGRAGLCRAPRPGGAPGT